MQLMLITIVQWTNGHKMKYKTSADSDTRYKYQPKNANTGQSKNQNQIQKFKKFKRCLIILSFFYEIK